MIAEIIQGCAGAVIVGWCIAHIVNVVRRGSPDILDLLAILFMILGALTGVSLIAASIIR